MKLFLKTLAVFSLSFLIVINLVCYILIRLNLHTDFIENGQIYNAIVKSRKTLNSSNTILLGGSVANQMYYNEDYNGKINSFCSVMPITMAGQYLILKNISRHNNLNGKDVVLIMHPNGFTARLHGAALYHYFMKPFYNSEFLPLMDEIMQEKITEVNMNFIYSIPIVRCTNWTPEKGSVELKNTGAKLAPLTIHYLKKMEELAKQYHFKFKVVAPILPEKNKFLSYDELKKEISANNLDYIFRDYFNHIIYYSDNLFIDGFHLKNRNILPHNILNL
jgi:hypothetical protein